MPTPAPPSLASYDAVPYAVCAFPQTDPDRLAVIAQICGLKPALPQRARILELGCAAGGNLIPMALAYPQSQFIGVDLSQRQIEEGAAVIAQLGLANIKLLHMSITDITPQLGTFDYILAHGVYSWVPPDVQEKTLNVCRQNLAPSGIAYVSYNTYPGWHARMPIREMACYQVAAVADPVERITEVRRFLIFMAAYFSKSPLPGHPILAREIEQVLKAPDNYILHEYLEDFNQPLYFHEFAARLKPHGLQYLAEAEIATMLPARFGKEMENHLRTHSTGILELEQSMDFLGNRMFRQSLLCHSDITLDRTLSSNAIADFYIASPMKPEAAAPDIRSDKAESFVDPGRPKLTTKTPLMKAALLTLAEAWPLPLAFHALLERARSHCGFAGSSEAADAVELAAGLLNCYTAAVVELSSKPPQFITRISTYPVTTSYIRLRANQGDQVSNLRLENIALTPQARLVLASLDGTRDRNALIALVADLLEKMPRSKPASAAVIRDKATQYLDYILPTFAKSALLIA